MLTSRNALEREKYHFGGYSWRGGLLTKQHNKWVKAVFLLCCYGCTFYGIGNSTQLCKNFAISGGGGGEHPNPPWYATAQKTGLWCMVCGVWCMVCGVWCVVCGLWCMVCGVWFMVCGVWCMVYGLWCMVYGVWCMVCGVWCIVYGVWCTVYGGPAVACGRIEGVKINILNYNIFLLKIYWIMEKKQDIQSVISGCQKLIISILGNNLATRFRHQTTYQQHVHNLPFSLLCATCSVG
jgi:hypothetical protein